MKHLIPKMSALLLATNCIFSCSDESDIISTPSSHASKPIVSSFEIPIDSALANLYDFMLDADALESRANPLRKVVDVTTVTIPRAFSRDESEDVNCENLLYIANFEDGQGYAILAADKRISEKVIAITDQGSLNANQLNDNSEYQTEESDRPFYEGYPTTGPGFFTLPEYGDELFMNPNTVNLEIEGEGTLVGNFNEDDDGFSIQPFPTSEQLPTSLCIDYALNEINNYDDNQSDPNGNSFIIRDWDDNTKGGGSGNRGRVETTYSKWNNIKLTSNLLRKFSLWDQRTPFNDMCPNRRSWILFGRKKRADAGCFPLAIAKIFTYLEYPSTFTYNGNVVSWTGLKSNMNPEKIDKISAAALLRGIGLGCDSWYFYQGTFTFPWKGTEYMRSVGLNKAHSYGYSYERVTGMIDENKPLIIYGMPKYYLTKSHCWNIDGYKEKERTITTKTFQGDSLISVSTRKEFCKMVHCDFGWGGGHNGYYVSGVFNLKDTSAEKDFSSNSDKDYNYDTYLYIVMY